EFFRDSIPTALMSVRGAAETAPRPPRAARRPISRALIEIVTSRSVAFFGLAFGAQTVPVALDQRQYSDDVWFLLVGISMFGSLVLAVVAAIAKRFVRIANSVVISVFLIATIT